MANEPIISVSGLRGIVGETLTDDVAYRYAAAFAGTLPPGRIHAPPMARGPCCRGLSRRGRLGGNRTERAHLTVESSSLLRAPSTRVVATLLSGSGRRQESRGRLIGSLTTTCDDEDEGGAVVVTDDLIPGLAATTVVLPKSCDGRSQMEVDSAVPGTTVAVPGSQAAGTAP